MPIASNFRTDIWLANRYMRMVKLGSKNSGTGQLVKSTNAAEKEFGR
jgi:hypothetical protein